MKSNAVIFTGADRTLAVGAGQMSRVDAVKVAVMKAAGALAGSVAASDAFFPFRDGLDAVADAGATAVVQPGGSVRDAEVIAAADEKRRRDGVYGQEALSGTRNVRVLHAEIALVLHFAFIPQHSAFLPALSRPLSLFYRTLADSSIWDANEAFYVETPREMMERGDYINPTFNYEPRINKPVLSYWIVAGSFTCSAYRRRAAHPDCPRRHRLDCDRVLAGADRVASGAVERRRLVGGAGPGRVAAAADVRAAHLHRHLHLDVHGADAAVLCAGGTLSGAAPAVSRSDVRRASDSES